MKWEVVRTNAGFHLRLKGANGETIMTSEVYNSVGAANNALRLVRKSVDVFSSLQPDLVDERQPTVPFVVAATTAAADDYASRQGWARWRWVRHPDRIRGHNDPEVHVLSYPKTWTSQQITEFEENLVVVDRGHATIVRLDKEQP